MDDRGGGRLGADRARAPPRRSPPARPRRRSRRIRAPTPRPSSARRRRRPRPRSGAFPGIRSWRRTGAPTSTTTPTRPTATGAPGRSATRRRDLGAVLPRVRLGHLRQPRSPRDDLRRARPARAGDAPPATLSVLAAHATCRRRATSAPNPFQDFSRRRLLLSRPSRPGRDPDRRPPHPRGRGDRRRRAPGSRSSATTTSAARSPRGTRSSRCCRTGTGGSGSSAAMGVVGMVDPASGQVRCVDSGEAIGNSFAVDETGRRLHRHRHGPVPLRCRAGGEPR